MKRVLVLGSLNIDLVQRVGRMPLPGETLRGEDLRIFVGGKGANQACAAALLGMKAEMAGMVGDDVFASRLIGELQGAGVDTRAVQTSEKPSGSATILVLPGGENVIVISPGANADVSIEAALSAVERLGTGDFLLCQLEIPLPAVAAALKAAHRNQVSTILDPAPGQTLPDDLFPAISILTPNQREAGLLLGRSEPVRTLADAEAAAKELLARGSQTVIVKMGSDGCVAANAGEVFHAPGFSMDAVDTTAAGDTFNGALCVALSEGRSLRDAARFANAAAALSVTRSGAISAIPARAEVEEFLAACAANPGS
ncbi:MAG: ribokinase [Acidobacteriaceae bacterium]|nr:ribokinase [Acidobacteriaceae bacterium]